MEPTSFYITTTLPYVNAEPHIGFGLEIVAADVIARYHRLLGEEVIFNTGTDEHGQKIYEKALENNQSPQEYTDFWASKFADLKKILDLSYTHFIRTTNSEHQLAAQEFWRRCNANGYIYKKLYQVKYCVGCELEKQDSDLVDGKCPLHPNKKLEERSEENYFFKFSAFQEKLLEFYEKNPQFVKPESKFKEIKAFVAGGLKDFSISRLKAKMPWGIEVPGDSDHVMYVWFDALINYISTLGWPKNTDNFAKYWGSKKHPAAVQIAGKDNLRQQAAMWQAMLLAADLPTSGHVLINGFISIDGQKMSKSLGNVISPQEMVNRYGTDATRFLLMFLGPVGEDMDTSWGQLDTIYTAYLANGLGNLCSRVAKLCEKSEHSFSKPAQANFAIDFQYSLSSFNLDLNEAMKTIKEQIAGADQYLSRLTPWTKTGAEKIRILQEAVGLIINIAWHLQPFMPTTAQKILEHFSSEKITALSPLFPRIDIAQKS